MIRAILPAFALLLLAGCGSFAFQQGTGQDPSLARTTTAPANAADQSPEALYAAGMQELRQNRYQRAIDLFDAVEREHPFSTWATNAKLMVAYTEYSRNRYTEAIGALDRFIQLHPAHRDIAYAYYLRALSQYEQINDAERDQRQTQVAMEALQDVVNRFPTAPMPATRGSRWTSPATTSRGGRCMSAAGTSARACPRPRSAASAA